MNLNMALLTQDEFTQVLTRFYAQSEPPLELDRKLRHAYSEALSVIASQAAELERVKGGWIPASTPPKDGLYLIFATDGCDTMTTVRKYDSAKGWGMNYVTHYMPLPSAPSTVAATNGKGEEA